MKTFPELIRYWREHAGLSLSQAAAKAGMTKAHLWELEDGRARNPTIKTLAGLATAYNADLPYLAELAAAALSSEVQPVGSERSDDERSVHADPVLPAQTTQVSSDPTANADEPLLQQAWGALNFILAFYEPGQSYLDTNAWKQAEASGRLVHSALAERLGIALGEAAKRLLRERTGQ